MKHCTDCGKALRYDNKTGLCADHCRFHQGKENKFPCLQCGKTIGRTKTGLCRSCLRPKRPIKHCSVCEVELLSDNVTGRCGAHFGPMFSLPEDKWADYRTLTHSRHMTSAQAIAFLQAGGSVEAKPSKAVINEEVAALAKEVAHYFDTTPARILGNSRFYTDVQSRAVIASVLRRRNRTTSQIARRLGRDHSTIVSLLQRVPIYAEKKPIIPILIERLAA